MNITQSTDHINFILDKNKNTIEQFKTEKYIHFIKNKNTINSEISHYLLSLTDEYFSKFFNNFSSSEKKSLSKNFEKKSKQLDDSFLSSKNMEQSSHLDNLATNIFKTNQRLKKIMSTKPKLTI